MRKFQTDESRQIKEIHYSDDSRQMMVFFNNNSAYMYSGVSLKEFGAIISAESVGSEFSKFSKNKTTGYRRIR